jgi:hypothetical protein
MTHIYQAGMNDVERAKWREQANNAAKHMKNVKAWGDQVVFTPAFVFDDGIVKLPLEVALIQRLNEQALADHVFQAMLTTVSDEAQAAQAGTAAPAVVSPPAASSELGPCMRRIEPDFKDNCPNVAAGGLRITLRPAEAIEKRWGMHSLLTFVMDVRVCTSCFPKVNAMEVTDQDLRRRLNRSAQQLNNGVLVDWSRCQIEHVPPRGEFLK